MLAVPIITFWAKKSLAIRRSPDYFFWPSSRQASKLKILRA
jgi:hypothetical protein